MKPKNISLFEEAMETIKKRFVKNPVNKTILMYLYGLPHGSTGKFDGVSEAVVLEYQVPPYDNPQIFLSDIFEKSLTRLQRDGLIEKNCIGYCITQAGVKTAQLLEKIETYASFERKSVVEENLAGNLASLFRHNI